MSNTTKVPCGGFEIGDGLIGLRGVIDSRIPIVHVAGFPKYNQFNVYLEYGGTPSYDLLREYVSYGAGAAVVAWHNEHTHTITSNVQEMKINEEYVLGFVAQTIDTDNNKMYYSVVVIDEDYTLTSTTTSYTLTPST